MAILLKKGSGNSLTISLSQLTRGQADELQSWGFSHTKGTNYLRARVNPANLIRVVRALGKVEYNDALAPIVEESRKDYKAMKTAQKIKTMTKTELMYLADSIGLKTPDGDGITAYEHQLRGILYLFFVKRVGLYYDAGLGKTYIGIVLFDNLKRLGMAKRMLVITNTDLIKHAWGKDVKRFSDLTMIDAHVEVGVDAKVAAMHTDHDICIQSYQGYTMLPDSEHYKSKFDICFFDESSILKNAGNVITGAMRHTNVKRLILASGLPAPNKEDEYYPQMQIIGDVLANTVGSFRSKYMMQPNASKLKWLWVFKHGAREKILKEIEPYTIFARKQDWIDCPERVPVDLFYKMSKEQLKHYEKLETEYFTFLDSGEKVSVRGDLVLRGKLAQVTNGFLMVEEGDKVVPKPLVKNILKLPKFIALKEKVDEILSNKDNNIVVWGRFRNDIAAVAECLKGYNPAVAYGGVTRNKKMENIDRWLSDPDCRVMVSNPKSTKFGHTWLKASYMIWFSATESYEDSYQASQRNDRIGQDRSRIVDIRMIALGTIDKLIFDAIDKKQSIANYVKAMKGVVSAG